MKYITITTPDNIEIDFRLAGAGSRIAAAVIDMAVQSMLMLAAILIFVFSMVGNNLANFAGYNFSGWAVALLLISLFAVFFGYYIVCELLTDGRSLGKLVFKLRVVRENGQPIGFTQSLIRNLFRNTIDIFGIGIVSMMFSKRYKRLGDMAASTIVISENPSRIIAETISLRNQPDNAAASVVTEGIALTEDEYYFLKEYINRRSSFMSSEGELFELLTSYFSKKYGIDKSIIDNEFFESIISNPYAKLY